MAKQTGNKRAGVNWQKMGLVEWKCEQNSKKSIYEHKNGLRILYAHINMFDENSS